MESAKIGYPDEVVSAGQLLRILDSDAREVSALCRKACLKPKKDGFGNIYFSRDDVDVLRKVKELHEYSKKLQSKKTNEEEKRPILNVPPAKENKLRRKSSPDFVPNIIPTEPAVVQTNVISKIETLENNVVGRITEVLAEKLDGLDEVIVELIKAKTENETLRQKVNELNKENFALKNENTSYRSVGLGLYIKKSTDEFTF